MIKMEKKMFVIENEKVDVLYLCVKRDAVVRHFEEIETAQAQHSQAIVELQEQLSAYEESFASADSLAKAKQFKQFIEETKEELELIKQVNKAKVLVMYATLSDLAEEFFSVHKDTVAQFREFDKEMVATTGLGALDDNLEILNNIAFSLNSTFAEVRNILLDTGIVSQAEQNNRFRNTHLGQRGQVSELVSFEVEVRAYKYQLKKAGIL